MTEQHTHKVCDTKLRTVLITATDNAIEFVADFLFFRLILKIPSTESVVVSIAAQAICYMTTFMALRLWNRINWGRKVVCEIVK